MSDDRLILAFIDIALPPNKATYNASAEAVLDHPGPWANPFWRHLTGVDGAPWHLTATPQATGRTVRELFAIRQFVFGLVKEQSRFARRQFVRKPKPPALADGRDQLSNWLEVSWAKWEIDGRIDGIFRTEGVTFASSQGTIPRVTMKLLARIAAALFGPAVVQSFNMVDAEITGWLFTIFIYTSGRWRDQYATRQALIEEVVCYVSVADRGRASPQNVFAYLKTFREALSGQNLEAIGSERQEDPLYDDLLSVLLREHEPIASVKSVSGQSGNLFAWLTSDAERDDILNLIDDCLRAVCRDLPSTPSRVSPSKIHIVAGPVLADAEGEESSEPNPGQALQREKEGAVHFHN